MEHLGDIKDIKGNKIEPVDIVSFGSPCNNLSMAGNRKGFKGEHSSLFLEAIRIIREMRDATDGEYPRYIIWENVVGSFTSNNGEDFRTVLEEITESTIPIPKSGRWARSGMVRDEGFSLAWRTFDSKYWGLPQERKRVFLVADYRGETAGEILFECERLCGDIEESEENEQKNKPKNEIGNGGINTTAGGREVTSTLFASYGTKWNGNSGAYTGNHFVIDRLGDQDRLRRLTPLECERLMGFPDGWTDGDKDTPRYKALGNSVDINIVSWIFKNIVKINA